MSILIIIFIDDASGSCAEGFLNRQSLNMIVDAPTDDSISRSLMLSTNVTQMYTILSWLICAARHHINFVFAAKFNHNIHSCYPVLQMPQLELTPTGYLNVFKFELLIVDASLNVADLLCLLQLGQKYLLAYKTNPLQPLVYYVNVSNDMAGFTTPTSSTNAPICINYTSETSTTKSPESSIDETSTNINVSAITGGVLGTLVILIILVVLIIIMFLIYQRKKSAKRFSPNTCTRVSANVSSDALKNVYIPDNMLQGARGNQIVSKTCGNGANICAGTDNEVSHQNNPQEVSLLAVQWNHACT